MRHILTESRTNHVPGGPRSPNPVSDSKSGIVISYQESTVLYTTNRVVPVESLQAMVPPLLDRFGIEGNSSGFNARILLMLD